jgi:Ras-related protein Rab-5C
MKSRHSPKLVIVSATSTGKTAIADRFVHGGFHSHEPTTSAGYWTKTLQAAGEELELVIWDTGGSECYRSLAPLYYRRSSLGIVQFDLGRHNSFEEVESWIREIQNNSPVRHLMLVGNKDDLAEDKRRVTRAEAELIAAKYNIEYRETSAVTGSGVDELFEELVALYLGTNDESQNEQVREPEATDSDVGVFWCCR